MRPIYTCCGLLAGLLAGPACTQGADDKHDGKAAQAASAQDTARPLGPASDAQGVPGAPPDTTASGATFPAPAGTGGSAPRPTDSGNRPTPPGPAAPSPDLQSDPGPVEPVSQAPDAGSTSAMPNGTDASAPTPDGDGEPRGTGPGDWTAGDYPPNLMGRSWRELSGVPGQNGNVRQYKVHVPPGYDPEVPMPVVFCLHGLGQDALLFCVAGADMPAKADEAGFILVMPNGYQNSWNGGTCCGGAASAGLDDVELMRAIFEDISGHLNIDVTRVYATGLSNGGYMSYRLACEGADLFVAVAPSAGAIGMNDIGGGTSGRGDWDTCTPTMPVSVLEIHGTRDALIPYRLQAPSLERIATAVGCETTTAPATLPESAGDTTCVSYDCPAGIDVTGCSVDGGGHVWFGSPNCGTGSASACGIVGANSETFVNTDAIWSFLSAHSRP